MGTKHNRRYKDTVFVDLFGKDKNAKENFISLYNALHNKQLPLTTSLVNVSLDNVIYAGLCNDVSFLIDNKIIILAEHQSTINENMPLRFLEYIARLYEKLQNPSDRYLRKLSKIPTPEFYVFYNGLESYPSKSELKLSDAFVTEITPPPLELKVQVYNINKSENLEELKKCKALEEYSLFVEEVRHQTTYDRENGFTNAVKECIKKDILKDYLQRKSKEVINMLIAEYDYSMDIAVQRAEEHKIAFSQGIAQGRSEGISEGIARGIVQGIVQGRSEGMAQGIARGIVQGRSEGISEGIRQTAAALKKMGLEINQISQATGLSLQEIAHL